MLESWNDGMLECVLIVIKMFCLLFLELWLMQHNNTCPIKPEKDKTWFTKVYRINDLHRHIHLIFWQLHGLQVK